MKGAAGVTARTKCITTSAALGAALPCWKVAKHLPSPQADFPSGPRNGSRFMTEQELAGPGLRTFFRISEKWQMSPGQQRSLLGCPDQRTLDSWRRGDCAHVPRDVLIRISYVLGIYKALHTIFPNEIQADGWMMRPNSAPLFAGRSAIDLVAEEGVDGLAAVRKYLDAQLD